MTTEVASPPASTAGEVSDRVHVLREAITICETPENWTIYRRPDLTDQTFLDLCASIRESGIHTPLEISDDGYIISGHRRFIAAQHCGINTLQPRRSVSVRAVTPGCLPHGPSVGRRWGIIRRS
jgi:hypothetical protein